MKALIGKTICVWSLSLSLWPKKHSCELELTKLLNRLSTNPKDSIQLSIPFINKRTKKKLRTITPTIGFACIDGLNLQEEVEWLSDSRASKICSDSKQALMVLGSPISDPYSMEDGAVEAAHSSFRSLTGKIQFNSVYVAFSTSMTRSRMFFECRNAERYKACIQSFNADNARVIQHYKEIIEFELDKLGLSQMLKGRIVLTEYCRLGGKHEGNGCSRLRASGQSEWGEFAVAQMAYDHRWIGSMDLDEFIANDPAIPGQYFRPSVDALHFFDELSGEESVDSDSIQLLWFHSVFESNAQYHNIPFRDHWQRE